MPDAGGCRTCSTSGRAAGSFFERRAAASLAGHLGHSGSILYRETAQEHAFRKSRLWVRQFVRAESAHIIDTLMLIVNLGNVDLAAAQILNNSQQTLEDLGPRKERVYLVG